MNFNYKNKLFYFISIDLGTSNIRVKRSESEKITSEASVVALNTITNQVVAVGQVAKEMVGRTPSHVTAASPLDRGVITDFNLTQSLVTDYLVKIRSEVNLINKLLGPNVIVGVPSIITEVEINSIVDAIKSAGAKRVYVIDQSIGAALGAGIDIAKSKARLVVDIGGGTTDIAIVSMNSVVIGNTVKIAGGTMDQAIVDYVKRKYNVVVAKSIAEEVKVSLSCLDSKQKDQSMELSGRDLISGLPKKVSMTGKELSEAISPTISLIVTAIKDAIEKAPAEIVSDILEGGAVITGGGAQIKGIEKYFSKELKIPVVKAHDPMNAVINGLDSLANNIQLLEELELKDLILK